MTAMSKRILTDAERIAQLERNVAALQASEKEARRLLAIVRTQYHEVGRWHSEAESRLRTLRRLCARRLWVETVKAHRANPLRR